MMQIWISFVWNKKFLKAMKAVSRKANQNRNYSVFTSAARFVAFAQLVL